MKSYVINLDRATDRLGHIKKQFDRLNLSFERVPAVDARLLSEQEVISYKQQYDGKTIFRDWQIAHMSIFLSHLRAWNLIADGNNVAAAVFEDDVHLSDNFKEIAEDKYEFPEHADIIRLETTLQGMRLASNPQYTWGRMKLYAVKSDAWGSAGYIIRKDIAQWLLAAPVRFHYSADWMLFHKAFPTARALSVFQLDPAPCVQDQYHPNPSNRLNFSKETNDLKDFKNRLRKQSIKFVGAPVRLLLQKRAVSFK